MVKTVSVASHISFSSNPATTFPTCAPTLPPVSAAQRHSSPASKQRWGPYRLVEGREHAGESASVGVEVHVGLDVGLRRLDRAVHALCTTRHNTLSGHSDTSLHADK